jgi:transposase, IS30 family
MPRLFTHLSIEERRQLSRLRESRTPVARFAVILRRHRSTIHRELNRNCW